MLQPSTVVGRGTFIMVALCALGMGFMVRFFIAIALAHDGRKVRVGSGQVPAARLALGVFRITTALAANSGVNDSAARSIVRRSLPLRRGFGSAIRLRSGCGISDARVATARGMSEEAVRELVAGNTQGRQWGFFGEPRVNVPELNLALDARSK